MKYYNLYTLHLASDITLLGYEEAANLTDIDYQIKLVEQIVPPELDLPNTQYKPWSVANSDFYYLTIEGICTFLVTASGTINIAIDPAATEADALPFFHDTILSAALIYKNIFTLKASAVQRKATEAANLFCASNGGGKSALATVLAHNNYTFIDDNRVLLTWDETAGHFTIKNYHPKVELWNDVGQSFTKNKDGSQPILKASHPVRPGLLKFFFKINKPPVKTAIKVSNCFLITLMNDDEPTSFAPIKGVQKARTLLHHIHQYQLIKPLGKYKECFSFATKLIQQMDMLAINRAENAPFVDFVHLIVREMGTDMSSAETEITERLPQHAKK